jgi:predicted NBD/HSP70 family sugar kinase
MALMDSMESTIRRARSVQILQSILRRKRLTRGDLCKLLKLSPGAIAKYVKALLDLGLIRESESAEDGEAGRKTAGRKALYIEINPDRGVVIAIALYRTKIQAGIVSTTGDILYKKDYPYSEDSEGTELLESIYSIVDETLGQARAEARNVIGLGLAMGGHVDMEKGISYQYLFAKNWYSVPLKELLAQRFDLPVFVVKDSNACALGEQYYGEGIGVDNFLSIWLGTGVGMGIIIGGCNYIGASGYAGELGHARGGDPSKLCYCGRTGCLEGSTSEEYVLERCRDGLKAGVMSSMIRLCGGDLGQLRIEHAIAASRDGDRLSCNIFSEVGERIGLALCDVANLFNPALIIFRGPLIDGNAFLFDTIERTIKNNSLHRISIGLEMRHAEKDDSIHLKGLCSLVLNGLIKDTEGADFSLS